MKKRVTFTVAVCLLLCLTFGLFAAGSQESSDSANAESPAVTSVKQKIIFTMKTPIVHGEFLMMLVLQVVNIFQKYFLNRKL